MVYLTIVESLMLPQLNTITKIILLRLTLKKRGNHIWYPKKQRRERERERTKTQNFSIFNCVLFSLQDPYFKEIRAISNEFRKCCDSSTVSLTMLKSCVSMTFDARWTIFHVVFDNVVSDNVVFDHIDFAHSDSVSEFL